MDDSNYYESGYPSEKEFLDKGIANADAKELE